MHHSLAVLILLGATLGRAEEEAAGAEMEQIGEERYRIGNIIVDRKSNGFSVPGKILHLSGPLEYLAVSTAGMKGYESLLELAASPHEFNLACILVGLDDAHSVKPRYQFDERKAEGQAVSISISWEQDGKSVTVSGANAMKAGDETFDDDSWVYIGSEYGNYGKQFMADLGGTLIGFVHDPYSVIEHRNGGGIGDYGLLTGNQDVLPHEGSAVTLNVTVVDLLVEQPAIDP
jgi:hypothetical protein